MDNALHQLLLPKHLVRKMAVVAFLHLTLVAVLTWARKGTAAASVGCFTCQSFNKSDVGCEDPFHPALSQYIPECKQGMPNRIGLFLAGFCIKMSGEEKSDGNTIMVRTCSLTNMGRQCGTFEFEEKMYQGCLTTCQQDACNSATRGMLHQTIWFWMVVVTAWSLSASHLTALAGRQC